VLRIGLLTAVTTKNEETANYRLKVVENTKNSKNRFRTPCIRVFFDIIRQWFLLTPFFSTLLRMLGVKLANSFQVHFRTKYSHSKHN